MTAVLLEHISRAFGDVARGRRHQPRDRARRVRHAARARPAAARPRRCAWSRGWSRTAPGASRIGDARCQRRRRRFLRAAGPAPARHGVPVLRDLAAHDGVRQRRLSAAGAPPPAGRDQGARDEDAAAWSRCRALPSARRRRSPAASSSASRSRARWCSSRRCCCSTSRCRTSTPGCARRWATSSARCRSGSASPASTSPTIRKRRWRCPTAWW